ncbi:Retrovirus-related Pol polyprotein from transposon 412 [Araneus ventricosus]|uniref:Retrovirus-related Pol polyprotein from transposon 412 n=1 Tax=Araneus ventricosus TaxID=182803 RepID=A0A4Y2P2W7_ARAVE|nr:Retrovirus-related Pol polyprotein from transposon 412 [Araneus ventricosus]
MDAASLNDKPEIQKLAILLHVIGMECLEIYNTFSEVSSASMNDILANCEGHFVLQRNITYERQRLFLLVQREGQSVDDFITELRKQLRNCDYGSQSDSVLVDQLVRGLRESRLRERLLRVPDLDIKKAVAMCRAAETSKLQAQVYFTEERSIDAIKRSKTSSEVKPKATGKANKFRQPAKRQEIRGRKYHYCGSHHVLEPLKAELDRMVKAGVIENLTETVDGVSPLVIVQNKNAALQACLDPQKKNRAIKRPQYNLPTYEDIASKLAGAKYFSVLDAVSAFWQISLDEESSRFCTFSSPFGRFKFLRMPYNIKCAPERFQRVVAEMLEDIQIADNFFDDLIVWGKILEEHNETLEKVFKRCIEFNLKLSREKSQICQTHVTFLGHTLSSDGIAVDKSKLEPILTFFDPRIESEVVVDASLFGLGAVLQQRGKPIDFASSTLTPAQRNYAHIEKELLAVVYGCKKFRQIVPTIRPQEPVDEPSSNSRSSQESSFYDPISRSSDKDPYRTRYGRVVKPPSRYVAKF